MVEVLVAWPCPRCGGSKADSCGLCEATGRVERWLPAHLLSELRVQWKIRARRTASAQSGGDREQLPHWR